MEIKIRIAALAMVTFFITRAQGATSSRPSKNVTFRSPANLSVEELMVILNARSGYPTVIPKTMTPCARAIIACCNEKDQINEACSEKLGCGAFFFDDNPCDIKFVIDALKSASIFYNQFKSTVRPWNAK